MMLLTDIGTLQIRKWLLPRPGHSWEIFQKVLEQDRKTWLSIQQWRLLHLSPSPACWFHSAAKCLLHTKHYTKPQTGNEDIDSAPNRNHLRGTFLDFKGDLGRGQFDRLFLLSLFLPAPPSLSPSSLLPPSPSHLLPSFLPLLRVLCRKTMWYTRNW